MNATDQNVTPKGDEKAVYTPMWLKVLVIVLGAAIVGMLLLIVVKIAAGDHQKEESDVDNQSISVPTTVTLPPLNGKDFNIVKPAEAQLVAIIPAGNEVFLHFRSEDGNEQIVVLDRKSGTTSLITIYE